MKPRQKKGKKLSVAIITYNEEKNLKRCIDSVLKLADEIIVLDSFSTDGTEKIAKSYKKVRFKKQKFLGHVEQKNAAMALCRNDWILSLDADEQLSQSLQDEIEEFLQSEQEEIDGLSVARLTFHMGQFIHFSGWYPQYRYRIIRKGKAKWVGENPHDYLSIAGNGKRLKGDLYHFSFQDLSHQVNTINSFSSIVAFTRFKKGKRCSVWKTMGKPIGKFFEIYLLKRGFLDGFPGFVIAVSSAYSTFLKFAKMYELEKGIIQRPSNLRSEYGGE